jgi:hypothetical protein
MNKAEQLSSISQDFWDKFNVNDVYEQLIRHLTYLAGKGYTELNQCTLNNCYEDIMLRRLKEDGFVVTELRTHSGTVRKSLYKISWKEVLDENVG